jgi:hypothetical protein
LQKKDFIFNPNKHSKSNRMKEIETKISTIIKKLNTMNAQGNIHVQYKILAVLLCVMVIFQLGKCFGELIFYINN